VCRSRARQPAGVRYGPDVDADLSDRIGQADERFVPGTADGELIEVEHLARYWWACQLAPRRSVLDAGCGVGYGSAMLARAGATDVIGVDLSAKAVQAAASGPPANASFVTGDVHALPFDDGRFDLVVCFEVIEHVDRQDEVIGELARVLAPGGVLAISSPNRDVYPAGNPHHVHEYVPEELRTALAAHFAHVELRRQHAWLASAVLDDDQAADGSLRDRDDVRVAKSAGREPGSEPYTLALASREPLPDVGGALVLGGLADSALGAELERTRAALAGAQQRARDEIAAMQRVEADLRRDAATLLAELDERRAELRRVYASVSWRVTEPLRRARRASSRRARP
jgi:2-polyprenyl-3-methyl-5-hydroxy-6-metoxy-1,4-benzoquinol methylase